MRSLYFWRARYSDGEVVTSDTISYEQLDRARLRKFDVVHRASRSSYGLKFGPSDRLIWRRRGSINTKGEQEAVHLIAMEPKAPGQPALIKLVYEKDGTTELHEHFNKDHPWLHEPERLPCEL